jgi:hypothetical protein
MSRRGTLTAALAVMLALLVSGCGYTDGNPQAARLVARAYLHAYAKHDAAAICRLITPPLAATFAAQAGGSCERRVAPTLTRGASALQTGRVSVSERNARVNVAGRPGRFVGLIKFGSIWHVSESWLLR